MYAQTKKYETLKKIYLKKGKIFCSRLGFFMHYKIQYFFLLQMKFQVKIQQATAVRRYH